MKLLYKGFYKEIFWEEDQVPLIIIENKNIMNDFINYITEYIENGDSEDIRLTSDTGKDWLKNSILILEPFSLSLNNRVIRKHIDEFLIEQFKLQSFLESHDLKVVREFISNELIKLPLDIEVGMTYEYKKLITLFSIDIYMKVENLHSKALFHI